MRMTEGYCVLQALACELNLVVDKVKFPPLTGVLNPWPEVFSPVLLLQHLMQSSFFTSQSCASSF